MVEAVYNGHPTEFLALCSWVMRRIDGPQSACAANQVLVSGRCTTRWVKFWQCSCSGMLRGLTFDSASGNLLVGFDATIRMIDINTEASHPELLIYKYLNSLWPVTVTGSIAPYNGPVHTWTDAAGVVHQLIGRGTTPAVSPASPPVDFSYNVLSSGENVVGNGCFWDRNSQTVAYTYHCVPNLWSPHQQVAVRDAISSPFLSECDPNGFNCDIYIGGYDVDISRTATPCFPGQTCSRLIPRPTHNSAWIGKWHP